MCLCERGKFATQVLLFSVQVMALGSINSEVNMTAGEVLFLERQACCIISSASDVVSKEHKTNNEDFVFEPAFLLRIPRRHKPSCESHSIYVRAPQAQ